MARLMTSLNNCTEGTHFQHPNPLEPVFHFVQDGGYHGIASLDTVKSWARDMREHGVKLHETAASDLYVLLPGSTELIRVTLTVADGESGDELEVEALRPTLLESNVVYTCKI